MRLAAAAALLAASPLVFSRTARAEPLVDIDSLTSNYNSLKRDIDDMFKDANEFLEDSRDVRSLDKAELEKLITAICGLDVERNDDEADRLAKSLVEKASTTAEGSWKDVTDEGHEAYDEADDVIEDLEDLVDDINSVSETDANKSARSSLMDQVKRSLDDVKRIQAKLNEDFRALENVKDGVMKGSNNPTIRARMEYGKRMHTEMQSRFYCDAKEIVLSDGSRPDCVLFVKDACRIYEFKPDTNSSGAQREAEEYIEGVQKYYKDRPDPKALELCKQDSNGLLEFRPIGETYYACSSSRS